VEDYERRGDYIQLSNKVAELGTMLCNLVLTFKDHKNDIADMADESRARAKEIHLRIDALEQSMETRLKSLEITEARVVGGWIVLTTIGALAIGVFTYLFDKFTPFK
jgi:hypothetical protein